MKRQCTALLRAPRPQKVAATLPEYTAEQIAGMSAEQLEAIREAEAQRFVQMLRHGAADPDLEEKGLEARRPRGKRRVT